MILISKEENKFNDFQIKFFDCWSLEITDEELSAWESIFLFSFATLLSKLLIITSTNLKECRNAISIKRKNGNE